MATEAASMPVNGTSVSFQGQSFAATESNLAAHNANAANFAQSAPSATSNTANAEVSKEEVGWYFVEQYYTTLSKTPDKLFLFYNKRSQSVFGVEEEKAPVCVGQRAINERMKELDFQDCKVRVTNVDSQASGADIVIQVIGEISNKSAPHRKFVQTFVLAAQTNGYFVLNDIFRYIAEEEEPVEQEEVPGQSVAPTTLGGSQEPAPSAEETEPKTLTSSNEPVEQEHDAHLVDEELAKVVQEDEKELAPPAQVNGTPVPEDSEVAEAEDAPAATVAAPETTTAAEETAVGEADLEPEKPKDPLPSPAPAPAQQPTPPAPKAPAAAAPPPKPAAPKTWASLAASAARTAPPSTSPLQPTTNQQKPASQPPSQAAAPPSAPGAAAPPAREGSPAEQGDGWQAVGGEHKRGQSKAQGQVGNEAPRLYRAYIKNVYPSVDGTALKSQLQKYGELSYFDISRQKNCAFVDFATLEGFQAAVNANPHQVGSDQIFVEERRERLNQFQQRGGMRGGRGGFDNRPGQGRGGFGGKENQRPGGGFPTRGGRGGNVTPRGGRGGSQAV